MGRRRAISQGHNVLGLGQDVSEAREVLGLDVVGHEVTHGPERRGAGGQLPVGPGPKLWGTTSLITGAKSLGQEDLGQKDGYNHIFRRCNRSNYNADSNSQTAQRCKVTTPWFQTQTRRHGGAGP